MAAAHQAKAARVVLKQEVDAEIKMEEPDPAGLAEEERESAAPPKAKRSRGEAGPKVKEEPVEEEAVAPPPPEEGPSGSWDARLQEFLKTLQAPGAEGESPPLPALRPPWDGPKASQQAAAAAADAAHKWPQGLWVPPIQPHLIGEDGQGREIHLESVPSAKGQEGIFDGGAASVEKQRQRFRSLRYQEASRPWELCRQLRDLCRQWLRPERHTKEQMLELVTLEQFLALLPPEMQSWVRANRPETCAQAVTLAEGFLLQQREAKGWDPQITGVSEEESVNPPKAAQAVPEPEQVPLRKDIKQEADESGNFTGDEWLSGNKEKPFVEKPEQVGQQGTSFQTSRENKSLGQGEVDEKRHRAERQNGNDREKGTEQLPLSGAACKAVRESTSQDNENEGRSDPCGEGVGRSAHLTKLDSTTTQEKPYKCWHCGQSFNSSADLLSHERTHVGEKLYKCSQCGESERFHTGQQPHKCSHCGNIFNCNPHEGIDAGGKPYACLQCGKGYSRRTEFTKHQKIHRGEKPYTCSSCGEKFGSISHLQLHRKIHTGENPHQCSHCGKGFRSSSLLASHECIHTVERDGARPLEESFVCFACGKTFEVSSELVAHLQTHN
ncbi:zinc finger protein 397-like isoform X3 [Varanus komodoensis]|uniref:zinc finger protein 397-like isoform X3 n=1 Tax=Varanus komodoensis TaxID=61221 RepID=UPI001CF7D553|nr:zinc finger protein 397-like isoform X3 [Varanus komodoensis]